MSRLEAHFEKFKKSSKGLSAGHLNISFRYTRRRELSELIRLKIFRLGYYTRTRELSELIRLKMDN